MYISTCGTFILFDIIEKIDNIHIMNHEMNVIFRLHITIMQHYQEQ